MAADVGGRAQRRRAQLHQRRRRIVTIGVGAAVVVIVAVGGVLAASGGGDDAQGVASRPHSTSTSTTTTTTLPTATTVVPKSANAVVALAQQYDGAYEGSFTNSTYNTTGPAHLELRIDPAANTLTVSADFDGNVFGGDSPAKLREIQSTIPLGNPTAQVVTDTAAFGKVSGHVATDLAVELSALDIPEPIVKSFVLTGGLRDDRTGFDGTYHVVFEDGSTADGTVTLVCAASGQRPSEVPTLCRAS